MSKVLIDRELLLSFFRAWDAGLDVDPELCGLRIALAQSAAALQDGWAVRPHNDGGMTGYIVSTPRVDGVRTSTSVWPTDEDPAYRLLHLMLAARPTK
jgi:hypothetical protein